MFNYLAMMMAISSIFLTIADTPECLGKKTQLWGISADGGHRDLSQDEVPGRLRLYQFPGLSGPAAVGGPLPAGSGRSISSTERQFDSRPPFGGPVSQAPPASFPPPSTRMRLTPAPGAGMIKERKQEGEI